MEVVETLRTLRLLRTTTTTAKLSEALLWSLYLRTFGYEVDGMLARESFDSRNISNPINHALGISGNIDRGNLLTLPRIIEQHANLKSTTSTGCQVHSEFRTITHLCALEGLHALGVLSQTAKAEVLEADDTTIGDTCEIHGVVPYIVVVLHPIVTVGTAIHEAGITCGVVGIGRQTEDLEALAGYLSTGIFIPIAGLGCPHIILYIRIITRNGYLTTLSHRFLIPCDLHRGYHGLTGITEATWRTVIEDVPLTVDLLQ